MGLMKGSVSVCRFRIAPFEPDFSKATFEEIPAGSEIRRSMGFVPMKLNAHAELEISSKVWAGRMRVDEIKPDPESVADHYEELCAQELESGTQAIGGRRRRELKAQAVAFMSIGTPPKRRYAEWVLDGETLYVGSTNKSDVGEVLGLMRRCGAGSPDALVPWAELPKMESSILEFNAWGPRFLRHLFEVESGRSFELEDGKVAMVGGDCKISLSGEIAPDVVHHLEQGAEIVSAKLKARAFCCTLDAERWWIKGASIEVEPADSWVEALLMRVGAIADVFDALDAAFAMHAESVEKAVKGDGRAWIQTELDAAIAAGLVEGRPAVLEFMGPTAEASEDGRAVKAQVDEPPN